MSEVSQGLSEPFRCGYVALIGEPNVGKSTLLNAFLQQKLSIVTPKPQTTRHKILGILSAASYQVILLDTPGIITPRYALHEVMVSAASSAIADADLILLMLDATKPPVVPGNDQGLPDPASLLGPLRVPLFLVINKVDIVKADPLLYARSMSGTIAFRNSFSISALRGDGVADLLSAIVAELPVHPPFYPVDSVSDMNERFFVAEIIREKILLKYHEEIPYAVAVDVVEFKEREEGKWFVSAEVYVERDSQKGIVIGKKGKALKEVGRLARADIEAFLGHEVFLDLHVKVRKNWRGDEQWLRRLGYTPPDKHE